MKFYKLLETSYTKYKDESTFSIAGSSYENFDSGTELQEVEKKMSNRIFNMGHSYRAFYDNVKILAKDKEFQIHVKSDERIEIFVLKIIETEIII